MDENPYQPPKGQSEVRKRQPALSYEEEQARRRLLIGIWLIGVCLPAITFGVWHGLEFGAGLRVTSVMRFVWLASFVVAISVMWGAIIFSWHSAAVKASLCMGSILMALLVCCGGIVVSFFIFGIPGDFTP